LLSSGTGSYTQDGTGNVVLAAANTYTGATTVNGGILQAGRASVTTYGTTSSSSYLTRALPDQRRVRHRLGHQLSARAARSTSTVSTPSSARSGARACRPCPVAPHSPWVATTSSIISPAPRSAPPSAASCPARATLVLAGGGSLTLTNAGNTFSGQVVINDGTLVINAMGELGTGTSQISVGGIATTVGLPGGALVVQGGTAGLNFNRNLTITGRGPNTVGASLVSIGNNTSAGPSRRAPSPPVKRASRSKAATRSFPAPSTSPRPRHQTRC